MQPLQIIHDLFQAAGEQKIPVARQAPDEKLEHGLIRHSGLEIGLHHGELIEIGQQRAVTGAAGIEFPQFRVDACIVG